MTSDRFQPSKRHLLVFIFCLLLPTTCAGQAVSSKPIHGTKEIKLAQFQTIIDQLGLRRKRSLDLASLPPQTLVELVETGMTKLGKTGTYFFQSSKAGEVTIWYDGGKSLRPQTYVENRLNGHWVNGPQQQKLGGQQNIRNLLSKEKRFEQPSLKALASMQKLADQLSLAPKNMSQPKLIEMNPYELINALQEPWTTNARRGDFVFQVKDDGQISVWGNEPYGQVHEFANQKWQKLRKFPRGGERAMEALLHEQLLQELPIARQHKTHDNHYLPVNGIKIEARSYSDIIQEHIVAFPQQEELIEQIEGLAKQITVQNKEHYKLNGDYRMAKRQYHQLALLGDRKGASEVFETLNLIEQTQREVKRVTDAIKREKSSLTSEIQIKAVRLACENYPSQMASADQVVELLKQRFEGVDLEQPESLHLELELVKKTSAKLDVSADISRVLTRASKLAGLSSSRSEHFGLVVSNVLKSSSGHVRRSKREELALSNFGMAALENALARLSLDSTAAKHRAKIHRLLARMLENHIYLIAKSGHRDETNQRLTRVRYHLSRANDLENQS